MTDPALDRMAAEKFVSLTTFRRSGAAVPTPVWVAPTDVDGVLVVTTPSGSGKVKRLRNNPDVELRPCTRRGEVADGAPVALGRVELVTTADEVRAAHSPLAAKYGLAFKAVMLAERVIRRASPDRTVLRIRSREG